MRRRWVGNGELQWSGSERPASGYTSQPGSFVFTVSAEDAVGNAAARSVMYTVAYTTTPLYDQRRSVKSGATVPIKVQLTDALGINLSSATVSVSAIGLLRVSTTAQYELQDSGNANPDSNFRFDPALNGYIYNLKTTGFPIGVYQLSFKGGADPTTHTVQFQVQ